MPFIYYRKGQKPEQVKTFSDNHEAEMTTEGILEGLQIIKAREEIKDFDELMKRSGAYFPREVKEVTKS
jgi:hypothetical protein